MGPVAVLAAGECAAAAFTDNLWKFLVQQRFAALLVARCADLAWRSRGLGSMPSQQRLTRNPRKNPIDRDLQVA